MKKLNIKILKFVVAGALLTSIHSCKKLEDFGTTDVNPNGASEPLTGALLTNVEAQMGGYAAQLQPGLYCQYFAEPTYPGTGLYTLPQLNSSGNYSGPLNDLQTIIKRNTDPATSGSSTVTIAGSNVNQIAVAKVLQSYIFWTITDRWGDIPYSEALKGVENFTPKYDDQESVYRGLISDLKVANATFDENTPLLKNDIIYAGNVAKWRKFSNSLRMLIALRMSRKYPSISGYAATEFAAAYEDSYGHIEDNADNFTIAYPGGNFRNPWFTQGGSVDNGTSKTFTDVLNGLVDPRLNQMVTVPGNGVPYGLTAAYPQTPVFAQILATSKRLENSPLIVVSAATVWLAVAEAAELGWIIADSEEAYNEGVKASFAQWGVTLPASYLVSGPANFNSGQGVASIGGSTVAGSNAVTPDKLSRIALQQWIAYYPDGLQGWSNWRKSEGILPAPASGVPDIKPTVNARNSSGQIPRRYVYGVTEYSLNGDKLQERIALMPGGDSQDGRVWWDRN